MIAALTIAGSDSSAGAGIQADLKTFAAHGLFGTSAITAITAQNTMGVTAAVPLDPGLVTAQIEAVASDITLRATKIGMLANAAIVRAVADAITRFRLPAVVVDPVMLSKSGHALLDPAAIDALTRRVFPLAAVVTPNLPEAEALTGRTIGSLEAAREAARIIGGHGAAAVVIKGGHMPGSQVIDLLFDGVSFTEFPMARIDSSSTHGTGCTFGAAIAARLALGATLPDAVAGAQAYVAGAIRKAPAIGHGHGPLQHFWQGRIPHSEV